jgi:hypothetical protein
MPVKVLGLLHELVPRATNFALLVNPNNPRPSGSVKVLTASTHCEIDAISLAATVPARWPIGSILVVENPQRLFR